MKKRKIISIVVSLALAFGSMASLVVTADDAGPVQPVTTDEPATTEEPIKEPTILPNDWHFVDIAHNGDTIVALAKNDTIGSLQFNTQGRLYYSADGGETWKPSENQPLASNAQISSNRASQQQILYWKENNMFVAHGGASTYTSENGINWTENTALHWTTNTMFTTSGNCLIFGGQNSANATNDLTAKQFANNKFTLDAATPNYFSLVVAAKPVDSDGNVTVMVADKYVAYDLKFPYSDPAKANWSIVKKGSGTISEAMLYDAVYSQKTDQYFAVDGTEKLKAFTDAGARPQLVVSAGDTVTGVNANADGVIVGMGSGKFFYNNSDQILNSSNNTWTEITVMEGKTPATEPINNIEFLDDGSFIALGTTQIYKGSIEDGYKNINEKDEEQPTPTPTAEATPTPTAEATPTPTTEVTPTPTAEATPTPTTEVTPTPTAEATPGATEEPEETPAPPAKPFKNVRLIGGAYSPSKGQYVVYGDGLTDPENKKYNGNTYASTDGINWGNPWQSYIYTQREFTDATKTEIKSYIDIKNGAVWWEEQNKFLLAASVKDSSGIVMRSRDVNDDEAARGLNIALKESTNAETDFRLYTEIAMCNGNLYTTNATRVLRKYTAWSSKVGEIVKPTDVITLPDSSITNMTKIAVGNTEDSAGLPAVLMHNGLGGAIRNDESTAATEEGKWTETNSLAIWGTITDAVYSDALKTFVVVTDTKGIKVLNKENAAVTPKNGPSLPAGVKFKSIDTDGEVFMLAGTDGNIYTAPNDETFAAADNEPLSKAEAELVKIPSSQKVENQMPITNIFVAGDKFIATVSDDTDSDVLIISKDEEGNWSYMSVTEELFPTPDPTPTPDPSTSYDIEYNEEDGTAVVTASVGTYTVLFAAYDAEGRLIELEAVENAEVKEDGNGKAIVTPTKFTGEGAASGKLMLWDSLNGMTPLASAPIPFQ